MNLDLSYLRAKLVLPVDYEEAQFWLIGAGGTGSFMAMNLARLSFELSRAGKKTKIVIVDHDRVEAGNIPRSNFCFAEIGAYKAETLAGRITAAWGMEVGFVNESFTSRLLERKNDDWFPYSSDEKKLVILVGCVDNHRARLEMHESVKRFNEKSYYRDTPRLWWIDGGNGSSSGQVLIGNRLDEKEICRAGQEMPIVSYLPAPSLQHPDLLAEDPADKKISRRNLTCAERIRLGEQSLNINSRVAVEMTEMLSELLLTHNLKRFATYFDLESGSSRSLFSTPEAIRDASDHQAENPGKRKISGKSAVEKSRK